MISFREIIKEMLTQKTRLFLTVLAIAWSTASIAIMLSVGEGMRQHFGETMASVGKILLVVSPGTTSLSFAGQATGIPITLSKKDVAAIAALSEVDAIVTEFNFTALLYANNESVAAYPSAVSPEFSSTRNINVFPQGRFINSLDMKNFMPVIVLGNRVAKNILAPPSTAARKHHRRPSILNDAPLAEKEAASLIGQSIKVGNRLFNVIGIATDKMQMSSYGATDNYAVWIPSSTYRLLSGEQYFSHIIITPKDPTKNALLKERIKQVIATLHRFDPSDPSALQFWDSYEQQASTNQFFLAMQFFLGLIGFITLIVAGVGIANVMTVSVRNATREIGIRMAIGARSHHILGRYIIQALIATLAGGAIGILITTAFVFGVNQLSLSGPLAGMLSNFKPVLSISVLLIVMSLLGLIGLLAAWFPARHASRIDPIKALQHE